jgi:hypothetical protein
VAQVYPDFDARPGLTALSRLRHRQWTGEGVLVQLSADVRMFLEEERMSLLLHVDRADVHGFDGEG